MVAEEDSELDWVVKIPMAEDVSCTDEEVSTGWVLITRDPEVEIVVGAPVAEEVS